MKLPKTKRPTYRDKRRLDRQLQNELVIISVLIADLIPNPDNPRVHSELQIKRLMDSIREFSFLVPALIDDQNMIIAGNGRVEAAKQLGYREVPTIRISTLTEQQKRVFILADNRIPELGKWDDFKLAQQLLELTIQLPESDIELTGFATAEIDKLIDVTIGEAAEPEQEPPIELPAPEEVAVSRLGDLFQLGVHKLVCADARDAEVYKLLLNGQFADMLSADPPYNVRVHGHVSGLGKTRHREFAMASGEMSREEFIAFLRAFLEAARLGSKDGAIFYVFIDWRHVTELSAAAEQAGLVQKNLICWDKGNAGMGSLYRSQHELVFVLKSGDGKHINNFGLGASGRYRTNVWSYPGVNTFRKGRMEDLTAHPTVKPVSLVADAMRDCSRRGGIVLDPFCGSGTTILAAEHTGRRARCIEIDPLYVDVAIERWQAKTRQQAIHLETGLTFDELRVQRGAQIDEPTGGIRTRYRPRPSRKHDAGDMEVDHG